MPSLSDKLKSLGVHIGPSDIDSPPSKVRGRDLVDVLPGTWVDTAHGETFIVDKRYPLHHSQGAVKIHQRSSIHPISKWINDPALTDIPREKYAFIDTETTGLSGGAGVYTFLVGVGRIQGDHFHIAQFFMQDPAEETAQLSALETALAEVEVLVSYNGKAFDLPRLISRYKTHHWPPPLREIPHIDLLHLARRLWKEGLSSCTLGDIEYYILEFERSDQDVPGWKVADLFFEYLRTQDPTPLTQIFYHNEMDVLSMAAILNHICRILNDPQPEQVSDITALYSVGKFYADLGEVKRAEAILGTVLERQDLPPQTFQAGMKTLSTLYKKAGDFQQAIPLWEKAADQGKIYAFIELAKYYEHVERAYHEAVHWTLSAINQTKTLDLTSDHQDKLHAELEHRLARLKRKSS